MKEKFDLAQMLAEIEEERRKSGAVRADVRDVPQEEIVKKLEARRRKGGRS
jgi:hypothetical protein